MALLKHAFGQALEKDNELENTIVEERHDKGAPASLQSGRRPKTTGGIMRIGFEGETFLSMQHTVTTMPRYHINNFHDVGRFV